MKANALNYLADGVITFHRAEHAHRGGSGQALATYRKTPESKILAARGEKQEWQEGWLIRSSMLL